MTNALLGHLSLSAPPPPARPPGSSAWKAASLEHKVFVSRCDAAKAPSPSGQEQFDLYSGDLKELFTGSCLGSGHVNLPQLLVHSWGAAAASALTMADGVQPAEHYDVTGRQRDSAVRLSPSSSLKPNGELLGWSYPAIFSLTLNEPQKVCWENYWLDLLITSDQWEMMCCWKEGRWAAARGENCLSSSPILQLPAITQECFELDFYTHLWRVCTYEALTQVRPVHVDKCISFLQ